MKNNNLPETIGDEEMVVCSACGASCSPKDMMAESKDIGSSNPTVMFCEKCVELALQEIPVFYSLLDSQERDLLFDEYHRKGKKIQARVLNFAHVPEKLRKPIPQLICSKCNKSHGEYVSTNNGIIRVVLIIKALPIDFSKTTVNLQPICNDCVGKWKQENKRELKLYPVLDMLYQVMKTNGRKRKIKRIDGQGHQRRYQQPGTQRACFKKTGTHGG